MMDFNQRANLGLCYLHFLSICGVENIQEFHENTKN